MNDYCELTEENKSYLKELIENEDSELSPYAAKDSQVIRKYPLKKVDIIRTNYCIDVDRIIHNIFYNRYTDKTQVFSFYRNDDITRRALHVQLVSRIARTIGRALKLNLDLIEAIALGHDIGHTPFGHKGEEFLDKLYFQQVNRHFNHNVHSVRILKILTNSNLSLQTYDGVLCHCGEKAFEKYYPNDPLTFEKFEDLVEQCYFDQKVIGTLRPTTLEGCVVRICDMIAYVGKDRQDAYKAGLTSSYNFEDDKILGKTNSSIIGNIIINIIKNSINCNFLRMDKEVFDSLSHIYSENKDLIYKNDNIANTYSDIVKPMMDNLYFKLLSDVNNNKKSSPIYQHHIHHPILNNYYTKEKNNINANDIVVDYIASMTDDYFIDLYKYLFPNDSLNDKIQYHSYFEIQHSFIDDLPF